MLNEVRLNIGHEAQGKVYREDAGVLGLVLLEDIGLHCTPHLLQGIRRDFLIHLGRQDLITGHA